MTKTGIFLLALSAGLGIVAQAQNGPAPQVTVNGQVLGAEARAFTQNGRVLVPMRDIFESLGATVNYDNSTQKIVAQRGATFVRLGLGSKRASVNDAPVVLESAARSHKGRTYVPLRFVSEALGAQVNYDASQRQVSITGQGYKPARRRRSFTRAEGSGQTTSKRIYVGNLAYSTRSQQLQEAFAEFGEVTSAEVVEDRDTGQSRGFGYVEMSTAEEAAQAIAGLNGSSLDGRVLTVNEARPREARPGSGSGSGSGAGAPARPSRTPGGDGGRGRGGVSNRY